jgi:hypothetical protein
MDLINIQTGGTWGGAATGINENFSRTNIEVEKLKNATIRFKGYFSGPTELNATWPSPVVGDSAWAGSPYPGTVYECNVAGTWTNTGTIPETPSADLNNWNQSDW